MNYNAPLKSYKRYLFTWLPAFMLSLTVNLTILSKNHFKKSRIKETFINFGFLMSLCINVYTVVNSILMEAKNY
jgi:hypothetical protein